MLVRSYAMAFKSCTRAGGPITFAVNDCVALRSLGFAAVTEIVAAPGPVAVIVTTPAFDTAAVAIDPLLDSTV